MTTKEYYDHCLIALNNDMTDMTLITSIRRKLNKHRFYTEMSFSHGNGAYSPRF